MKMSVVVVAIVVAGCVRAAPITRAGSDTDRRLPGKGLSPARDSSESKLQVREKEVNGKQAPNLLIPTDGTRCVVSANEYRDTLVGDRFTCRWQ